MGVGVLSRSGLGDIAADEAAGDVLTVDRATGELAWDAPADVDLTPLLAADGTMNDAAWALAWAGVAAGSRVRIRPAAAPYDFAASFAVPVACVLDIAGVTLRQTSTGVAGVGVAGLDLAADNITLRCGAGATIQGPTTTVGAPNIHERGLLVSGGTITTLRRNVHVEGLLSIDGFTDGAYGENVDGLVLEHVLVSNHRRTAFQFLNAHRSYRRDCHAYRSLTNGDGSAKYGFSWTRDTQDTLAAGPLSQSCTDENCTTEGPWDYVGFDTHAGIDISQINCAAWNCDVGFQGTAARRASDPVDQTFAPKNYQNRGCRAHYCRVGFRTLGAIHSGGSGTTVDWMTGIVEGAEAIDCGADTANGTTATDSGAFLQGSASGVLFIGCTARRSAGTAFNLKYDTKRARLSGCASLSTWGDVNATAYGFANRSNNHQKVILDNCEVGDDPDFSALAVKNMGGALTGDASTDVLTTATAHTFVAGTRVILTSLTGGAGLTASSVVYYVLAANLTATTFQVAITAGGVAVDFTTNVTAGSVAPVLAARYTDLSGVAATGILTTASPHGFAADDAILFTALTGGDGLALNPTLYYVLAASLTATTFTVSSSPGGAAAAFTTDVRYGSVARSPAAGGALTGASATNTLTTATAHGFASGDRVAFMSLTGGSGLSVNPQVYFVIATGLTSTAFKVALTSGGAAVALTTDVTAGAVAKARKVHTVGLRLSETGGFASSIYWNAACDFVGNAATTATNNSGFTLDSGHTASS